MGYLTLKAPFRGSQLGFWLMLALVLIAAYALRVRGLDHFELSWDEGYSTWIIRQPLLQMIEITARDVHPPLYYLLLRLHAGVLGIAQGEFTLRYLSVLLGMVSVALVYILGAAVGGRWSGLIAAALVTVARANIDIARDTRMHMLAMLCVTLALWAAVRWFRRPEQRRWLALYAAAALAALFAFYLTIMALIAANLAFIAWWWPRRHERQRLNAWVIAHVGIGLIFAPWALYTYGQLLRGPSPAPMLSPLIYVQFYLITLSTGFPTYSESYIPIYAAVTLIVSAGVWMLARARRRDTAALVLLLAGVIVPLVVVLVASLPFHDLARPVAARYFLSVSAAFYALAAWAIIALMRRSRGVGFASLLIVFGAALYGLMPTLTPDARRDLFVSISETLHAHRQPDDALILNNDKTWPALAAKYDAPRHDIPHGSVIALETANNLLTPIWEANDAVWLITTPESLVSDPTQVIAEWLDARAVDARFWTFNEYGLAVYARTESRAQTLDALIAGYTLPDDAVRIETDGLAAVHQPLKRYRAGDAAHLALFWSAPPDAPYKIALVDAAGLVYRTVTVDAPTPAPEGFMRQAIRVPLTLDLPTGDYTLRLAESGITLASLTLVVNPLDALNARVDAIPNPLNWRVGNAITLLGYDISSTQARAGDEISVRLYWQTDSPIDTRYKVIVYALGGFNPDTGNPLWGQQDSEPFNWEIPTTAWPQGVTLGDTYTFRLAPNTPAGEYQVGFAMYAQLGGQRLSVTDAEGVMLGDSPILTRLRVE